MPLDLSTFHRTFFEESVEGLAQMEAGLLAMQGGEAALDIVNAVFRAAHSIKGGAGTFGFTAIAQLTHSLETLLDELRDGRRAASPELIDLLLTAVDSVAVVLTDTQAGRQTDPARFAGLRAALDAMAATAPGANASDLGAVTPAAPRGDYRISFAPHHQLLASGNDPFRLFRELSLLGDYQVAADLSQLPPLADMDPESAYLRWTIDLRETSATDSQVAEVFEWVADECDLVISARPAGAAYRPSEPDPVSSPAAPPAAAPVSERVTERPIAAASTTAFPATAQAIAATDATVWASPHGAIALAGCQGGRGPGSELPATRPDPTSHEETTAAQAGTVHSDLRSGRTAPGGLAASGGSIRVKTEKIDALINLVGELVITQSMLGELGQQFEMHKLEALRAGLAQLERNTRELQENVIGIRMVPVGIAFSRFPRMAHDISRQLGKPVQIVLSGEQTELDKTVIEKIGDPLVHLVRNALDHGIEAPAVRLAAGKPALGTVTLDACHRGGEIFIEVSDDGAGLDAGRIRRKAEARGLLSEGEPVTDERLFDLIFEPGFSTAERISDLSGRGVGMDVVRRNIKELGGAVQVRTRAGAGTTFTIRLPLTLAILDGQLLRIGGQTFVAPLVSMIETVRVNPALVATVAGDTDVYRLRDEYLPILRPHRLFSLRSPEVALTDALLMVVEAEGRRVGMLVDELTAQQQVVIKSLETNFRPVRGLSGATILGDGAVALILDVAGLIALGLEHRGALPCAA